MKSYTEKPNQPPDISRDAENPPTPESEAAEREENLDKTIADSFPDSDPPSSIPNPA